MRLFMGTCPRCRRARHLVTLIEFGDEPVRPAKCSACGHVEPGFTLQPAEVHVTLRFPASTPR